jgi:hypothetical protein
MSKNPICVPANHLKSKYGFGKTLSKFIQQIIHQYSIHGGLQGRLHSIENKYDLHAGEPYM